jgi:nucleotide-binding universal stress UspA family protein
MKTITAATDFSGASKNAVKYAAGLALELKAALQVVHVYESPLFYTNEMPYTAIEAAEKLAESDAHKKMKRLEDALTKVFPELKITTVVKKGLSADVITDVAQEAGAMLLVTGATGVGAVERALIGSTTTSIINKASMQVLIIPENARFKEITKIVYTTDLHKDNIQASKEIIPLAKAFNAELVFLFVDSKIHIEGEKISREMSDMIHTNVTYPKLSGYVCTDSDVMNGIELFIKKNKAEMLCMLTHHRKFPRMLWDRSLTQKMAYHPKVPLLVLHAPQ